jgi:hypothetical protein
MQPFMIHLQAKVKYHLHIFFMFRDVFLLIYFNFVTRACRRSCLSQRAVPYQQDVSLMRSLLYCKTKI